MLYVIKFILAWIISFIIYILSLIYRIIIWDFSEDSLDVEEAIKILLGEDASKTMMLK